VDRWEWAPKRVAEKADGTPRYSLLEVLAQDERSGLVRVAPGRYRSTTPAPYPRG
jgi:hypothetical protein